MTAPLYLGRDPVAGLIRARTAESVSRCQAGGPAALRARLAQLDAEWDLDRTLAAAAAGGVLGGVTLALLGSRRWYALAAIAGGLLLQHALRGSSPPVEMLRRMGVRTTSEIDDERRAICEHLATSHDIPAQHPTKPSKHDYVETALGRIKPASQS